MNIRNLQPFFYGVLHALVPLVCGAVTQYIAHSPYATVTVGTLAVWLVNFIEATVAKQGKPV